MSRFYDADGADKRITTVNEYLGVFPDPDPLGLLHLEGEELQHRLARLSMFALEPATNVVGGPRGLGSPIPMPTRSAPEAPVLSPPPAGGMRSGSATQDVSSLGANDAEAA